MRRRLGDRRTKPRYDVVGSLSGTLEAVLRLPLANVSPRGALFESHIPLPPGSVHRLAFECDGHAGAVDVKVRHVRSEQCADGEVKYLIGAEFTSFNPALAAQIARWMQRTADPAAEI